MSYISELDIDRQNIEGLAKNINKLIFNDFNEITPIESLNAYYGHPVEEVLNVIRNKLNEIVRLNNRQIEIKDESL